MNRLRELRKAKGWTVREVSDLSGIVFSTISALENGRRKMNAHHAKVLAPLFGVSEAFIIGDDNFAVGLDIQGFFTDVWADLFDEVVSGSISGKLDARSRITYVIIDRILNCSLCTEDLERVLNMIDALIKAHEEVHK